MFLIVIVLTLAANVSFSSREDLEETLFDMERAIRFGVDEAALKNSMIRIHFTLDKTPQKYALEYGPNDNFVLPQSIFEVEDTSDMTEEEKKQTSTEKLNKKFNKIREFQDSDRELPDNVRVVAIGSSLYRELISDFQASFYIYPTGEKDKGFLALATDEEVATFSWSSFTSDFETNYYPITGSDFIDIQEKQLEMATELFQKWKKN